MGIRLPVGVAGELWLAAERVSLAVIYEGQTSPPSASSIVTGERFYRSGDRVRRRADGALEFLGRLDQQIKLGGLRIEPGEIESS